MYYTFYFSLFKPVTFVDGVAVISNYCHNDAPQLAAHPFEGVVHHDRGSLLISLKTCFIIATVYGIDVAHQ